MPDKDIVWLHGEVKSPPFAVDARLEAGYLLRKLQQGHLLSLPDSRPMPRIGVHCHELRIQDEGVSWRVIYRIDADAVIVVEVFAKKSNTTPDGIVAGCRRRLVLYDREA